MKKKTLSLLLAVAMLVILFMPTMQASAGEADATYLYGTVDMSYADFYYGELENVQPDSKESVTAISEDPVVAAGYTKEGMYDAVTSATPKEFIFEKKWDSYYHTTYAEAITDDEGIVQGGKILGVTSVNVAINKKLYENAKKDPNASVLNKKISEITLNKDQSEAPASYKVLNSNAVYSKYVNTTETSKALGDATIHTNYMGDDNWWETRKSTFTVAKFKDQILGGFIEWKADPDNADETASRAGLKHVENIWDANTIGWGCWPGRDRYLRRE